MIAVTLKIQIEARGGTVSASKWVEWPALLPTWTMVYIDEGPLDFGGRRIRSYTWLEDGNKIECWLEEASWHDTHEAVVKELSERGWVCEVMAHQR